MTCLRVSAATTALGLVATSVLIAGGAPAQRSTAKAVTVETTVVHGACRNGGQVTLVVTAAEDGFDVAATATGMTNGDRWRGALTIFNLGGPVSAPFHRIVADGGWSVEKHLDSIDNPRFRIGARPARHRMPNGAYQCSLVAKPQRPLSGQTNCRGPIGLGMTAASESSITRVRWSFSGARPHSTWDVEISAESDAGGTAIGFETEARRDGSHQGHLRLDVIEPRLRLTLEGQGGQRCALRIQRSLIPT